MSGILRDGCQGKVSNTFLFVRNFDCETFASDQTANLISIRMLGHRAYIQQKTGRVLRYERVLPKDLKRIHNLTKEIDTRVEFSYANYYSMIKKRMTGEWRTSDDYKDSSKQILPYVTVLRPSDEEWKAYGDLENWYNPDEASNFTPPSRQIDGETVGDMKDKVSQIVESLNILLGKQEYNTLKKLLIEKDDEAIQEFIGQFTHNQATLISEAVRLIQSYTQKIILLNKENSV